MLILQLYAYKSIFIACIDIFIYTIIGSYLVGWSISPVIN